jgi:hypothetical protein
MRRKLSLVVTLFAWLVATGGHWDLTQAFAWGKMFATYSKSMSFSTALKKTFSTEGMCDICRLVDDAKKQESESAPGTAPDASGKSFAKLFHVFAPADLKPAALPVLLPLSPNDHVAPSADRAAPPLPPPRSLA